MFYYIIFYFIVLTVFYSSEKQIKGVVIFWFLFLTLLSGLRYDVGADYMSYVDIFNMIPTTFNNLFPKEVHIEWGAYLLMYIIKALHLNVYVFFFLMSFISFVFLYKSIIKLNPHYAHYSVIIYFAFFFLQYHFNIIRHGVMVSLVWYAFSYIEERNFRKFITYIIIGGTFHILAFAMIPFYWLLNRTYSFKFVLLSLLLSFVLGTVLSNILLAILMMTPLKDSIYYYTELFYANEEISTSISLGTILNTVILIVFIYLFKNKIQSMKIISNALFYALLTIYIFRGFGIFGERIGGLLNLSIIFIIPYFFAIIKKNSYIIVNGIIVLYCILLLSRNLTSINSATGKPQFLPYKTIFSL